MVAALKHGRNSLDVELDPAYCQQAASRLLHENTNLFGNAQLEIELKSCHEPQAAALHERSTPYKAPYANHERHCSSFRLLEPTPSRPLPAQRVD